MNKFFDSETWKWIRTGFEILLIVAFVYLAIFGMQKISIAEERYTEAYVICMPEDKVNVRAAPQIHSDSVGTFDPGEKIYLDGKARNGYLHCVELSFEQTEGWISNGHVVYDEPLFIDKEATVISKGRLAARKNVEGKRVRWLKKGTVIHVYYLSEEWTVTNKGYIMTKFLEINE